MVFKEFPLFEQDHHSYVYSGRFHEEAQLDVLLLML